MQVIVARAFWVEEDTPYPGYYFYDIEGNLWLAQPKYIDRLCPGDRVEVTGLDIADPTDIGLPEVVPEIDWDDDPSPWDNIWSVSAVPSLDDSSLNGNHHDSATSQTAES